MANICSFSMMVKGKHDDIEQFYKAMSQDGNIWMGRGADAEIDYDDNYDGDGTDRAQIDGWCKWSVSSAMISNAISMRTEPNIWAFSKREKDDLKFITLIEATEQWNLVVEVFSEEPGCCFQEHYVFDNGTVLYDECIEYYEYCICDYDTKEEAEKELEIEITDEEWDSQDYISRGGFGEWEFDI